MRFIVFIFILFFNVCVAHGEVGVDIRACYVSTYTSQIGVRESHNKNDGLEVGMYLKSCGLPEGYEYCSAFCSWVLVHCGYRGKVTAWAPAWFCDDYLIYHKTRKIKNKQTPTAGDLVGYYYTNQHRIGHVGFIDLWGDKYITTVEANVGNPGGVYKMYRPKWQIYAVVRVL